MDIRFMNLYLIIENGEFLLTWTFSTEEKRKKFLDEMPKGFLISYELHEVKAEDIDSNAPTSDSW
jgi:hypothetical protein